MQEKINKIIFIIIIFLTLFITTILFLNKNKEREYINTVYYMDSYMDIRIYTNKPIRVKKVFKEIENILSKYEKLTDSKKEYENIINVYTLNNNKQKDEYISIDQELYNLISLGKSYYNLSNKLLNINTNCILDKKCDINIDNIVLKENNKIKNNKLNINLDNIKISYTLEKVKEYLIKNNINNFILNAEGIVVLGNEKEYNVGIQNPKNQNIIDIISEKNKSIVTIDKYSKNIINPLTKEEANNMQSITVISYDTNLSSFLANTLFLMDIKEFKNFLNNYDVKVLIVDNNNKLIKIN